MQLSNFAYVKVTNHRTQSDSAQVQIHNLRKSDSIQGHLYVSLLPPLVLM